MVIRQKLPFARRFLMAGTAIGQCLDGGLAWLEGDRIDHARSAELRTTGILRDGEQIRFVVSRIHDGQPLAGKIRSAWEGILEDAGLGDDVVRHSLRIPQRLG